jgi:hypothetical protein
VTAIAHAQSFPSAVQEDILIGLTLATGSELVYRRLPNGREGDHEYSHFQLPSIASAAVLSPSDIREFMKSVPGPVILKSANRYVSPG